jgi:hypothetical protein
MKKRIYALSFGLVWILLVSSSAFAESYEELAERIAKLEEKLKEEKTLGEWTKRINLSGLIEVEASYDKTDSAESGVGDEDTSDLVPATIELGIDVDVVENVSGHILLLYEDGEDFSVDEGFIRLDGGDGLPIYFQAGEMYIPFGNFQTYMVSDPLTLELGETQEAAAQIGFDVNGFYGSVYAFNGDVDEDDSESHMDNYGANLGYAMEKETFSIDLGVC